MPDSVRMFGSRLSPFVEKVARALQLKKIPFELEEPTSPFSFRSWNPQARKMPVLEIDGKRIYDSTFICRHLDAIVASPSLLSADPEVAAAQRLLEDWSDEGLYWYGMALRWTPKNAPATAEQVLQKVPSLIRPLVTVILRRQVGGTTVAQGMGRLPEDILLRELEVRLHDLVAILGQRKFFYSDQVSVADLSVYGQFHMLRSGPTPEAAALIEEHTALRNFIERVEAVTQ